MLGKLQWSNTLSREQFDNNTGHVILDHEACWSLSSPDIFSLLKLGCFVSTTNIRNNEILEEREIVRSKKYFSFFIENSLLLSLKATILLKFVVDCIIYIRQT